jgi:hypothetical protein
MNYLERARQRLAEYQHSAHTGYDINDGNDQSTPLAPAADNRPLESVLKGRAIELWSDALGERFWLVADEEDAILLGERRGRIYTAAEARCVIQIGDPSVVAEVHRWKQRFNGMLRSNSEKSGFRPVSASTEKGPRDTGRIRPGRRLE